MDSTSPPVPLTTTTSPTRTWFSRMKKKPLITSRTRFWAPKPMARPSTPAEARMGATETPSSLRITSKAITQTTISTSWRNSRTRVSARLVASEGTSPCFLPDSTSFLSMRARPPRTTLMITQAMTRMSRMRRVEKIRSSHWTPSRYSRTSSMLGAPAVVSSVWTKWEG